MRYETGLIGLASANIKQRQAAVTNNIELAEINNALSLVRGSPCVKAVFCWGSCISYIFDGNTGVCYEVEWLTERQSAVLSRQ